MGSFKAVTAKALVDAGVGAPVIACVPDPDPEVAGGGRGVGPLLCAAGKPWCAQLPPGTCLLMLATPTPPPRHTGVAAWAIEQLAQHGEETSGPLVTAGALMALTQAYCRCGVLPARAHAPMPGPAEAHFSCAPHVRLGSH